MGKEDNQKHSSFHAFLLCGLSLKKRLGAGRNSASLRPTNGLEGLHRWFEHYQCRPMFSGISSCALLRFAAAKVEPDGLNRGALEAFGSNHGCASFETPRSSRSTAQAEPAGNALAIAVQAARR